MPYPPQKAYQQTAPGTALDPQRNSIAGGTGNAHTIPGCSSGNSSASPMNPYNVVAPGVPYSRNLNGGPDGGNGAGRELVGTSWSGTSAMSIGDVNANGVVDTGDFISTFSFSAVDLQTCSAATLTFDVPAEVTPGTIQVRGQVPNAAIWANTSNMPSAATYVGPTVNSTTAVALKTLDVTAIVNAIVTHPNWVRNGRVNFAIFALASGSNCNVSNEASNLITLTITP